MLSTKDYLLGFLAHYVTPQRAYYGGLLVTNTRGVPKEFRHSEAIKPSRLQASIYGDSLDSSLGSDAIAPALYNGLTLKPDILFIEKDGRDLFGTFLQQYTPSGFLVTLSDPELALPDYLTLSMDGDLLEPVDYDLRGSNAERVYAYLEDPTENSVSRQVLNLAQKRMNLFSPFARIRIVLMEIAQVEQGRTR